MFWFFGLKACGILAPQGGIEPAPPALKGKVLTTGPPGKSHFKVFKGGHTGGRNTACTRVNSDTSVDATQFLYISGKILLILREQNNGDLSAVKVGGTKE